MVLTIEGEMLEMGGHVGQSNLLDEIWTSHVVYCSGVAQGIGGPD